MIAFETYLKANITKWSGIPFLGDVLAIAGYLVGGLINDRVVIEEAYAWSELTGMSRGIINVM